MAHYEPDAQKEVTKREDNTPRVGRYAASDPRPKTPDRAIGFVGIRTVADLDL